jgi:hypothetical protein
MLDRVARETPVVLAKEAAREPSTKSLLRIAIFFPFYK